MKEVNMASHNLSLKLSAQDRKDLDKFTKYLVFKTIQIIVQSRLGEKIKTKSKPHSSGSDWFNLAIKDMPEVLTETKKALGNQIPTLGQTLCIEISLKTVEGDTMILETWSLGILSECDSSVRITYTVYNRMGILLKSLLAVTRVTPAYKLSRRQGSDTYVICYRIYLGEPQVYNLGEGYEQVEVGSVGTPTGTISLKVRYRTRMMLTPHKVEKDYPMMLKSDHFRQDFSPRRVAKPCHIGYYAVAKTSVVDEIAAACEDSQDMCNTTFSTSPAAEPHTFNHVHHDKQHVKEDLFPVDRQISFSEFKKVGAFAVHRSLDLNSLDILMTEVPFIDLLQHDKDNNPISNKNLISGQWVQNNNSESTDHNSNATSETESHKSSSSVASAPDDFVMIELRPPFASGDITNELGTFYRDCQTAPPLVSFTEQPTLGETVNELNNQLIVFESSLQEFDKFVESLQDAESWM